MSTTAIPGFNVSSAAERASVRSSALVGCGVSVSPGLIMSREEQIRRSPVPMSGFQLAWMEMEEELRAQEGTQPTESSSATRESERDAKQPVVCPRCGGTKTGTKDTGFSMCFECGVFWGWRAAADDPAKAPLADKTAFDSSALFGADAEHERAESLSKTVRWLIGQIDAIHLALCPGQNGVWQERVRQAVEAAEKAPNGKHSDTAR